MGEQAAIEREGAERTINVERENITFSGGASSFNDLTDRPMYADEPMTSETNIPSVEGLREYVGEQAEALRELISDEATARSGADTALGTRIDNEILARQGADNNLQSQIDAISASSDVADIVGTYAELQAYDTSTLGNNDIIKVLQDESRNDETTYYRWNATTQQFTLIGEEGPYYTKSQTDALLNGKQDAFTVGNGLALNNSTLSVDTTTIATKTDLLGKLDSATTFWGQTVNNGAVTGRLTLLDMYGRATTFGPQGSGVTLDLNAGNRDFTIYGLNREIIANFDNTAVDVRRKVYMYNNPIVNLADPTNAQDAATKNYVDTAVASAGATTLTDTEYNNLWSNS